LLGVLCPVGERHDVVPLPEGERLLPVVERLETHQEAIARARLVSSDPPAFHLQPPVHGENGLRSFDGVDGAAQGAGQLRLRNLAAHARVDAAQDFTRQVLRGRSPSLARQGRIQHAQGDEPLSRRLLAKVE